MVDNRDLVHRLDSTKIAKICDRHRGVGADGLIMIEPAEGKADLRMRYFNADGGEVDMCGNGARCFSRFAQRIADVQDSLRFETPAGIISAEFDGELVHLGMSGPTGLKCDHSLEVAGKWIKVHFVNTGVPHAVVFVENLVDYPVLENGRFLRHHADFAPAGTNVNFVHLFPNGTLSVRTYERGVEDETLACGTGVVACALIAHLLHGLPSPVTVRVAGGDDLMVHFVADGPVFREVKLIGPADFVFEGTIAI